MKSLLALLIVLIHTVLQTNKTFESVVAPVARIAVPLFFIFSGYFFFRKIQRIPRKNQSEVLFKSIKRDLQLYFFWFIVLFIPTVYARSYFVHGFWNGIKSILVGFFLSSTFIASWYIMALVIGIPVIYLLSRVLNSWVLLLASCLIYCFYVIITNYGASPVGIHLSNFLNSVGLPYISFPVGFVWIMIGKLFADGKFNKIIAKSSLYLSLIAFAGLYLEQWFIIKNHFSVANDNFFMLMPVAILLFGYILTIQFDSSHEKELRAFSTITYCLHATLAPSLRIILGISGFYQSIFLWIITVLLCMIVTMVIIRLEKKPHFEWLRFSH